MVSDLGIVGRNAHELIKLRQTAMRMKRPAAGLLSLQIARMCPEGG
jgi:hypothetical protein